MLCMHIRPIIILHIALFVNPKYTCLFLLRPKWLGIYTQYFFTIDPIKFTSHLSLKETHIISTDVM